MAIPLTDLQDLFAERGINGTWRDARQAFEWLHRFELANADFLYYNSETGKFHYYLAIRPDYPIWQTLELPVVWQHLKTGQPPVSS